MLDEKLGDREAKGTLHERTRIYPRVSLIVGLARIILSQASAIFDLEERSKTEQASAKAIQEAQLVRGVMECSTVLAPLILLVDTFVSLFFLACIFFLN